MANSDPGTTRKNNQCRWLHDWGKWEVREISEVHYGGAKGGMALLQERRCDRCGYTQTKLDTVLV